MPLTLVKRQAVSEVPIKRPCKHIPFCQKVLTADTTNFQLITSLLDGVDFVQNGSFDSPLASGTTTATSVGKLVDAGATFFDDGIEVSMTVENKTDSTIVDITAIDSTTQLSLLLDQFTSGEDYEISGWNYDSSWNTDAGTGLATKNSGSNGPFIQNIGVLNDQFYRIDVTIQNLSALGIAKVRLGGNDVQGITEDGSFTIFVDNWRLTPSNDLIEFTADLSATTYEITDVRVSLLSSAGYRIRELDGTEIANNYTATDILHGAESLPAETDRIQVGVDWGAIAIGCYDLCIVDTGIKNIVVNGRFNGQASSDWTFTPLGKWETQEGKGVGDASGGASPVADREIEATLSGTLTGGKKYTLQFDVVGFVGGDVTATTDDVTLTAQSANGTFIETIDLTSFGDQTFLKFTLSDTNGELNIDNVLVFEDNETKDCSIITECFDLKDVHEDTVLVEMTHIKNAIQLDYANFPNYVQGMRLLAEVEYFKSNYWNKKDWVNSMGQNQTIVNTNVAVDRFSIGLVDKYVHLFLSNVFLKDFTIDGETYTTQENEYIIGLNKDANLKTGDIEVIERDQFFHVSNC